MKQIKLIHQLDTESEDSEESTVSDDVENSEDKQRRVGDGHLWSV